MLEIESKENVDKESKADGAARKRVRHRKKLLYDKILKQMEFYFSDANITKDRFLSQLVAADPLVPLETFLKFNNIRALTHDTTDIAKAMKHSTLLELSEDRSKVKRKIPPAEYDADERTVYVESIPATATREWLQRVFSEYGQVAYISLPKFRDSQRIKGFAFVEFGSPDDAQKCINMLTKMGSLLPTSLPPEELTSIKTFADEPPAIDKETSALPDPSEKESHEPPKKKAKKNKDKKKNLELKLSEHEPMLEKLDTPEEETPSTPIQEGKALDGPDADGDTESARKRRKKRAETRAGAVVDEARGALWGMQVLSKRSWKSLRNRYLNLQRAQARAVRRGAAPPPAPLAAPPPAPLAAPPAPAPAPLDAQPDGVFVRVTLAEPSTDVRETKRQFVGARGSAGCVHADARAGRADVVLRFRSADAATRFVEESTNGAEKEDSPRIAVARVLNSSECAAEWARAAAARAARGGRGGRAPALPQPTATHVRFDDE